LHRLKRNNFASALLSLDDVGHTADNPDLHLVSQVKVTQARAAQNQAHTAGFQRFE
jgi:hypothetical protein